MGVITREPLQGWFTDYRGFPDGIGPATGPLELIEVPQLGPVPARIALVCRFDDWDAIAVLPALLSHASFAEVKEVDVWLVSPERDPHGAVFAAARELNILATRPELRHVSWFAVERPACVTGLPRGVEAVVEILAAEAALRDAGHDGIPRSRPDEGGAAAPLVRGAGAATLETLPAAWSEAFVDAARGWLATHLPGQLANSDLVPESELSEAWATVWGWDPVPWRWVPRWTRSRTVLEAWLAERLWTGSGWNRALEDAFVGPVLEWLEDLTHAEAPTAVQAGDENGFEEEQTIDEPDPWADDLGRETDPADDEEPVPVAEPPALPAVRRAVKDARRLAEELSRQGRVRPIPHALGAIDDGGADGYRRFLVFKRDELALRLAADEEGATWPEEPELAALADALVAAPEEAWSAVAARLEVPLRDAALKAEADLVEELISAWDDLNELGSPQPSPEHPHWRPSVALPCVWAVVLRWVLGARGWPELWRALVVDSLGAVGGVHQRWAVVLQRVQGLSEERWLELADWGAMLDALGSRGRVPPAFWELAGSRRRLEAPDCEFGQLAGNATKQAARRRLELLKRAMEPRVRLTDQATPGGAAAVRVERPAHLDPELLQSVAPNAQTVVADVPAAGRLAVAVSWTDLQPFLSLRVCAQAARRWRNEHPDPTGWQPLPPDQERASDSRDSRRAGALALLDALRAGLDDLPDPVPWIAARTRELLADPAALADVPVPDVDEVRALLQALPDDSDLPLRGGGPALVERLLRDTPGADIEARLLHAIRPPRSSPWAAVLPR